MSEKKSIKFRCMDEPNTSMEAEWFLDCALFIIDENDRPDDGASVVLSMSSLRELHRWVGERLAEYDAGEPERHKHYVDALRSAREG